LDGSVPARIANTAQTISFPMVPPGFFELFERSMGETGVCAKHSHGTAGMIRSTPDTRHQPSPD